MYPYRLLRFVHELKLSGIGPSRWLLATLLQEYGISTCLGNTSFSKQSPLRKMRYIGSKRMENRIYRSNKSVSFPSSGGICPVSRLSFSSLQRQKYQLRNLTTRYTTSLHFYNSEFIYLLPSPE